MVYFASFIIEQSFAFAVMAFVDLADLVDLVDYAFTKRRSVNNEVISVIILDG